MVLPVKDYLAEMESVYLSIMKKCIDTGELSEVDRLFLEVYRRTIGKI